jgi:hypothetical protein
LGVLSHPGCGLRQAVCLVLRPLRDRRHSTRFASLLRPNRRVVS